MRRILILGFMSLLVCPTLWAQTAADARAVQDQLTQLRKQLAADAQASGKPLNAREVADKVRAKLESLIKDVDPSKIEAKDALDWARLFQSAGQDKVCCDLARKYLETSPADPERFQAMYMMAQSCNALGEADMLAMTLDDIPVPDARSSSMLGSMTTGLFVDTIYTKKGLVAALATLDAVEKKMVPEDPKVYAQRMLDAAKAREKATPPKTAPKPDEERLKDYEALGVQANESQVFAFANKRADLYKEAGKSDEAAATLKAAAAKLTPGSPAHRRATAALTMMTLTGSAAPAIVSERSHGPFEGLASLHGKVVVIDFFAHWCGPCIASFPDMEQMYADLHGKGLEVVGVTTYYGYYKGENVAERDMPKDTEFGKMAEFITEHKIPWPVVYGQRSNLDAYGVTGIPTAVVIDREGKVHTIHVGYSKESFKAFREEVEKLVGSGS